jgi:nitrilase
MPKAAVIQMTSSQEVSANFKQARILLEQAAAAGAQLAVLPEMWATMFMEPTQRKNAAEPDGHGPIQDCLQRMAQDFKLWIIGGTIPLQCTDSEKIRAACLVFNAAGERVARYDKIHLFDAIITPGQESYQESATTEPGTSLVSVDTPIGKVGLAVCYDIRFPELFRALRKQQVDVFAVPAAFTVTTGKAHWEVLTRARAIENFCYLLGSCQWGTHDTGRQTFGDSCIIDPWGRILQKMPENVGCVAATIDLQQLREIRQRMPVDQHHRL